MRYHYFLIVFVVSLCGLLAAAGVAQAIVIPDVQLNLTSPGGGTNQLTMTITEHALGTSDTQTGDFTGHLTADFGVTFGPGPAFTASVTDIGYSLDSPGNLELSNMTFILVGGLEQINVTGVKGSLITPPYPPSAHGFGTVNPVTGDFAVDVHDLQLNGGNISDSLGLIDPPMDLGAAPQNLDLIGPDGTVTVTKAGQVGDEVTYNVDWTLPIQFSGELPPPPETSQATIAGIGQLHATGSFTHIVPEPGTIAMLLGLAASLVGYGLWRRRS